eukprot:scaffold2071_cov190-Alexandrium_tamarense.AAC.24
MQSFHPHQFNTSFSTSYSHMIWIFFPIPVFCLVLLAMPWPPKVEKVCTDLVGSIFFTRVSVGVLYIRLVWVFVGASMLLLSIATRTLRYGFGSAHVPCSGTSCPFHTGETMWYRRASRYRAERNFWLSLFTIVLWLLVYKIYALKKKIMMLREDISTIRNDGYKQTHSSSDKKKD